MKLNVGELSYSKEWIGAWVDNRLIVREHPTAFTPASEPNFQTDPTMPAVLGVKPTIKDVLADAGAALPNILEPQTLANGVAVSTPLRKTTITLTFMQIPTTTIFPEPDPLPDGWDGNYYLPQTLNKATYEDRAALPSYAEAKEGMIDPVLIGIGDDMGVVERAALLIPEGQGRYLPTSERPAWTNEPVVRIYSETFLSWSSYYEVHLAFKNLMATNDSHRCNQFYDLLQRWRNTDDPESDSQFIDPRSTYTDPEFLANVAHCNRNPLRYGALTWPPLDVNEVQYRRIGDYFPTAPYPEEKILMPAPLRGGEHSLALCIQSERAQTNATSGIFNDKVEWFRDSYRVCGDGGCQSSPTNRVQKSTRIMESPSYRDGNYGPIDWVSDSFWFMAMPIGTVGWNYHLYLRGKPIQTPIILCTPPSSILPALSGIGLIAGVFGALGAAMATMGASAGAGRRTPRRNS